MGLASIFLFGHIEWKSFFFLMCGNSFSSYKSNREPQKSKGNWIQIFSKKHSTLTYGFANRLKIDFTIDITDYFLYDIFLIIKVLHTEI